MAIESNANLLKAEANSEAAWIIGGPRLRLLRYWPLWAVVAIALSGGLGFASYRLLLHQAGTPRCEKVFWPFASASLRIYCAQELASKQTLEDLFAAIALVDALGADHPLRSAINPLIEQWSTQALDLAEKAFHAGKLERAIQFAKRIPAQTTAHKLVQERIARWQRIWAEGEAIYNQANAALNNEDWRGAYRIMVKLLDVENRYWAGTQYDALTEKIILAQKEESKLAEARQLLRQGSLDALSEALAIVQELIPNSIYVKSARKTQNNIADKLLAMAESSLERRDFNTSMDALQLIPQETTAWQTAQDLTKVAQASASAWNGTITSLEDAIQQVSQIGTDRPLYRKAQALIGRWQGEIANVRLLQEAQARAQTGDLKDLSSAVAQAQRVSSSSDQFQTAQQDIEEWQFDIEARQDQPILDRADQLALSGKLQAAIKEAQKIKSGRFLYEDAQLRIADWQDQLRLPTSVAQPPAALSSGTNADQQLLKAAEAEARQGNPDALANAIAQVNQISPESPVRFQAQLSIDAWSERLLDMARSQVRNDPQAAIAIARQIPKNSRVYESAQLQIQSWQRR